MMRYLRPQGWRHLLVLLLAGTAVIALVLAGIVSLWTAARIRTQSFNAGEFGEVQLFQPAASSGRVVVLVSDSDGWSHADTRQAKRLAKAGAIVVGLDLADLLPRLNEQTEGCHWISGDLEAVSRAVQQARGFTRYHPPVLVGRGDGGMLVLGAAAQALPRMFAGAVVTELDRVLPLTAPICLDQAPGQSADGPLYPLPASPNTPVTLLRATGDDDPGPLPDGLRREDQDGEDLAEQVADIAIRLDGIGPQPDPVAGIPVVEIPAEADVKEAVDADTLAIIWSGDGGWRDIDSSMGDALAARGIPVAGIDSFEYFWHTRTPDEMARDLDRLIRHYTSLWGRHKVLLIGYSFGADTLPFAVSRLPDEDKAALRLLGLLSPSRGADFQINVAAYLGNSDEGAFPLMPEMAKLSDLPIACLYGEEDADDSLCTEPGFTAGHILKLAGGHHFDGDYDGLLDRLLAAAGIAPSAASGEKQSNTVAR